MRENSICRLCLNTSPTKFPLLYTKAADMLEALTNIKVEPTDEILTMCLKCSLNLKLAYSIQRNFLLCDEQLKSGLVATLNNESEKKICTEEVTICEETVKVETPAISSCIVCDEVMDEISLISHTKQHFEDKQFCDLCNQNFSDIKSYRTHLVDHPEHSPHKCEKCDKTFLYKSLYDIHVKSSHVKKPPEKVVIPLIKKYRKRVPGPPFKCDMCSKEFSTRDKLRRHRYGHIRKECPVCKKSITSYNYCRHVQSHHSGPQVCEHCGKTYPNIENLRGHILYQHRGIKYECKECNLTFKCRNGRNNHNKRVHGTGNGHVCETCGRKFYHAYVLKKHILTSHMKARPYSCEFCKKNFSRKNSLRTHRRQHTNETPYRCEDCGEGFRQNVSLRSHRKSKHNVIETVTCNCDVCGKGFSSEHALVAHMRCH